MKYIFAAVYALVLATQLPHVWHSYAALEAADFPLASVTAWGAAIAFELATGVFTLRVVMGSRKRATRSGLAFFIVGSAVANAFYYRWLPVVFDRAMPIFATVALPIALALFAEEFGTELKRERTKAIRAEREAQQTEMAPAPLPTAVEAPAPALPWVCSVCGIGFTSQQALAGHAKAHRNGNGTHREPLAALQVVANDRQNPD